MARQDDERWKLLADESGEEDDDDDDEADDLGMDTGDAEDIEDPQVYYAHRHRHPEAFGRTTLKASNEKSAGISKPRTAMNWWSWYGFRPNG